MMGRTHSVTGVVVGLGYGSLVGAPLLVLPLIVLAALVGVMVPDFDHPRSTISRSIPVVTDIISWVLRHLSRMVYAVTKGSRDEDWSGSHRHLTHTCVFAFGVSVGLCLLLTQWFDYETSLMISTAFGLGCITHDIGDSLTLMGCPFLWPLPIAGETWYEINLLPARFRFKTGGTAERFVVFPLMAILAVLLVPGVWSVVSIFLEELVL